MMKKYLSLGILSLAMICNTAMAAEYHFTVESTPTDWTTLVSGKTFVAGDTINVAANTDAANLTLTGVNDIAGTFHLTYGTGSNNLKYTLTDTSTYATNYFRLTGDTSWQVDDGTTATIHAGFASNTTASAPYAFTKTGAGTLKLTLPNSNQYTSVTGMNANIVVAKGTLELASATSGTSAIVGNTYNPITVKSGATLLVSASRAFGDYRGQLTLEDDSTVTFTDNVSNNDFLTQRTVMGNGSKIDGTGCFSMRGSPQVVLTENTTATISANVFLMSSTTFEIAAGSTLTFSGTSGKYASFDGMLIKTGEGTLVRSGLSSNASAVSVNGGTLEIAAPTGGGNSSGLGNGTNEVSVGAGANLLFSVERAAGMHSGTVTLAAQTDSLAGGKITFNSNDNSLAMGNTLTLNNGSSVTGTGGWCLRTNGATTEVAPTVLLAGVGSTATVDVANLTMYGSLNNVFEVTDVASTLTISSRISSPLDSGNNWHEGITVRGAGTVVFNNSGNTFSNNLTVEGGTVLLSDAHFFREALNDYSQLKLSGGTTRAASLSDLGNLTSAAGRVVMDGGTLELTGANTTVSTSQLAAFTTYTGNGGGVSLTGENSTMEIDTALTPGGTYTMGGTANYVITDTGSIGDLDATHPTSVVKSGTGTLAIHNANTYTGSTTLSAGAITLGVAGALPENTVLTLGDPTATTTPVSGATLQLGGFDLKVSRLSGDGGILNSGTSKLYINVPTGETTTYRGDYVIDTSGAFVSGTGISGNTEVHITGGGTFIGTGLSTFTGDLYIEDGSWFVVKAATVNNDNSATGAKTNTIHVGSGATLEYGAQRAAGGGASVDIATGGQMLVNSGDNSIAWGGGRSVTLHDGSLVSSTKGGGSWQFRGGSTIRLSGENASATVENVYIFLRDSSSFDVESATSTLYVSTQLATATSQTLTKKGAGTLVLENASHFISTYAQTTKVTAGTLQIGNHNTTGVLKGTLTVQNGGTLAFARSDAYTLPADMSVTLENGATLSQVAASTLTLGNTLTLPGNGTVNLKSSNANGTLSFQNQNAPTTSVTVQAGDGLVISKASQFNNVTVNEGATASFYDVTAQTVDLAGTLGYDANSALGERLDVTGVLTFSDTAKINVMENTEYGTYSFLTAGGIAGLEHFEVDDTTGLIVGLLTQENRNAHWLLYAVGTPGNYTGMRLSYDTAAVPEPGSFWMLLLGLAAFLRKRKP